MIRHLRRLKPKSLFLGAVVAPALLALGAAPAQAAPMTFTVTSTLSPGSGSISEAITAANANPGLDTIAFNLPNPNMTSGPFVIAVLAELPEVTDAVIIDGRTQSGFQFLPVVVLLGTTPPPPNGAGTVNGDGLRISAGGSTVRSLVVAGFGKNGIHLIGAGTVAAAVAGFGKNGIHSIGAGGNSIFNCVLGRTSQLPAGNGLNGLFIEDSPNNIIGGSTAPPAPGLPSPDSNLMSGNGRYGIEISGAGATSNVVQNNGVGINETLSGVLPNAAGGVAVSGARSNLIGAVNTLAVVGGTRLFLGGNIISGNSGPGVSLLDDAQSNIVQNNSIGTDRTNEMALPNATAGVFISNASRNVIGTVGPTFNDPNSTTQSTPTGKNIISGNTGPGVLMQQNANANVLKNNRIGLGFMGTGVNAVTKALPNTGAGVQIADSSFNTLGGLESRDAGNLIAGNSGPGVLISATTGGNNDLVAVGSQATGNQLVRNSIGILLLDGTTVISNAGDGVEIINAPRNRIGRAQSGAFNTIIGNGGDGISITGALAAGNLIQRNDIGVFTPAATSVSQAAPNVGSGILIDGAVDTIIGGAASQARNNISGNERAGISLIGSSKNTRVLGNFIGTNFDGTSAIPNGTSDSRAGVEIGGGSSSNIIGGETAGAGNVISGNAGNGILLNGTGVNFNRVQGNRIGTDAAGSGPIFNGFAGISVTNGAQNNVIGGTMAGARNLLFGSNTQITVFGAGTNSNRIQGNFIGTNVAGNAPLVPGNTSGGAGIRLVGVSNTLIGGTAPGAGNVIGGQSMGIEMRDANNNKVQANFIGTDAEATVDLANTFGICLVNSANNIIGGTTPTAPNVIARNTQEGIFVTGDFGSTNNSGNTMRGNRIFANGSLGINLVSFDDPSDGVTPNDAGDADTGPNKLQNFPELAGAGVLVRRGPTTVVSGLLNSTPGTAFIVDFYSNAADASGGPPEGETYLGRSKVTTDARGNVNFNFAVQGSLFGQSITATATNVSTGDTSEFSAGVTVLAPPTLRAAVPVALSSSRANAATETVQLNFSGALDAASAGAAGNYQVRVSGASVGVQSATVSGTTVTLQLADGALKSGDKVTVAFDLRDAQGQAVAGQTSTAAR